MPGQILITKNWRAIKNGERHSTKDAELIFKQKISCFQNRQGFTV